MIKIDKRLENQAKWSLVVVAAASMVVLLKILSATLPKISEETLPTHEDEQLRSRFYEAPLSRVISAAQTVIQGQKTLGRSWRIIGYDASTSETQKIHVEVPVLNLTDDLVITLKHEGDGDTRVDCVSASRVSPIDFGQNKRNVEQFLVALDEVLKRA